MKKVKNHNVNVGDIYEYNSGNNNQYKIIKINKRQDRCDLLPIEFLEMQDYEKYIIHDYELSTVKNYELWILIKAAKSYLKHVNYKFLND